MVSDDYCRVHCWLSDATGKGDATGRLDKMSQDKRKNWYMNQQQQDRHRVRGLPARR